MNTQQLTGILLSIAVICLSLGSFIDTARINALKVRIEKLEATAHERDTTQSSGQDVVAR